MKRRFAMVSTAMLAGLLPTAAATSAPRLTLDQQAVKAEVIVRATAEAPTSVQESGQTWTVYPLTVLETLAGDAQGLPKYQNKPSVWILSGIQDGPSLPGGEVMLLLYKAKYDSALVGFNQGAYSVQGGAAGSKVVLGLPSKTPGVADPAAPASADMPGSASAPQASSRPAPLPVAAPPALPTPPAATPPLPAPPQSTDAATAPAAPSPAATTSESATPEPTPISPAAASTAAAQPPTPSAATSLPPGQMTLEAFRQAVLSARAKAGK